MALAYNHQVELCWYIEDKIHNISHLENTIYCVGDDYLYYYNKKIYSNERRN